LTWQCCLVYIDDIIVFSPTFERHLDDLERVFTRIREANMFIKLKKCHFCRRELPFLGHLITEHGVKPDPAKLRAIDAIPPPQNVKDLRTFLGLTGYYRRFIRDYAAIARPLSNLTS